MSASDIFKALQLAKGMKNTKVGVVEIDITMILANTRYQKSIPDISQCNSVEIFDDGMRFWRYFDMGEGMYYPCILSLYFPMFYLNLVLKCPCITYWQGKIDL